jgi:soluble lytic murein transglycosylase
VQVDAREALQLAREGRAVDALKAAEKAWRTVDLKDPERPQLAFLLAALRGQSGDKPGALAAMRVAATHPSLGLHALRALADRADEQGLAHVVLALTAERPDPVLDLLRAKALRRSGQLQDAFALLERVPAPKGTAWARKVAIERMRLAHARGQHDDAVAQARALMAGKSAQAEEAVDFLLGGSDAVWQARLQKHPNDAAAVLDALVWSAQRRRYARVAPALEALAQLEQVDQAVRCHARSWLSHVHDRKAEFAKSLEQLELLNEACATEAVQALKVDEDPLGSGVVAWRKGRALVLQGNLDGLPHLRKAVAAGLGGPDADDAQTLLELGKWPDARELFEKVGKTAAQDYAERDIVDVVAWQFALARLIAGKWQEALTVLDRQAKLRDSDAPGERRYDDRDWSRGRADYFAGRALQALNRSSEALARWRRVVQRHPLSYYATMSQAQLRLAGEAEPAVVRGEACGPGAEVAVLAQQGVQRARVLGQLGWHEEAGDELDLAGIGRDGGADRWAVGDPGAAWTRAALDDEAGRWTQSHALGRDQLRKFATAWPTDANRGAWQLAYPRAYRTLVEDAAKEFGLHPSVVWAIGRSESGFNPRVESHAAAIGLLQLILPTAQAMAKPLGLTADAQTLRQPAVNVRLGARYLKLLFDRFGREAQMAAGYNAGGGAVGRWRKTRGEWPLDLFVETIPFRETRDYAKRVQSAIAVYRNLYDGDTLHAFLLSQKPVPVKDETPTEPATTAVQGAQQPAPPVKVAEVTTEVQPTHVPKRPKVVEHRVKPAKTLHSRTISVSRPVKAKVASGAASKKSGRTSAQRATGKSKVKSVHRNSTKSALASTPKRQLARGRK